MHSLIAREILAHPILPANSSKDPRPFSSLSTPDTKFKLVPTSIGILGGIPLQQPISSCQPVYTIITFTPGPHESTNGIGGMLTGDDMPILINMANVDLDGRMVLCGDETTCSGAVLSQLPYTRERK